MIIVNADDFGRSVQETDLVLSCFAEKRISSTTAMMFMADSERAAREATRLGIEVGLHLNLSQRFTSPNAGRGLRRSHESVVKFLTASKYAVLVYNPFLRRQFRDAVEAQFQEFERVYGRPPSHVDGHQHQHLCANLLVDKLIPTRQRVRRSFSFWTGEKNVVNRSYRALVDRRLSANYVVADFFFSLATCLKTGGLERVFSLAQSATVELMTHPLNPVEYQYLISTDYVTATQGLAVGTYSTTCK